MAERDSDEEYITPIVEYKDDEKDPEHLLKICVDVPGLRKKTIGGGAKNADIKLVYDERSFTVTVVVTEPGPAPRTRKYQYAVKQLPEAIRSDPGVCFTKVRRKDEVIVYLAKARPGRWARMLSSTGLETATEEEEKK